MDNAILSKVIDVTAETLEVDAASIAADTEFKALGADSFDLLELVTAFEDEFGMTMDDTALGKVVTVSDAVAAIEAAQ